MCYLVVTGGNVGQCVLFVLTVGNVGQCVCDD